MQRLQLLALAVALGLLGGQPAVANPPTLTKPTVSGPPSWTQAPSAKLTFTSPDAGVTFVCRTVGPNWPACTSPVNYTALSEGPHTFSVKAVAGREGGVWSTVQDHPLGVLDSLPTTALTENVWGPSDRPV